MQRWTKERRCPICGGFPGDVRGKAKRCYGYLSSDGAYAHCTREEFAGAIQQHRKSDTFPHRLEGNCLCDVTHGEPYERRRRHFGAAWPTPRRKGISMSTNSAETTDKQSEIPHWARLSDGEHALANVDEIIATFKKGHERALDAAVRKAWFGFYDSSFTSSLEAVATFRQSLAVAQLVRERIVKLLEQLRSKAD